MSRPSLTNSAAARARERSRMLQNQPGVDVCVGIGEQVAMRTENPTCTPSAVVVERQQDQGRKDEKDAGRGLKKLCDSRG